MVMCSIIVGNYCCLLLASTIAFSVMFAIGLLGFFCVSSAFQLEILTRFSKVESNVGLTQSYLMSQFETENSVHRLRGECKRAIQISHLFFLPFFLVCVFAKEQC